MGIVLPRRACYRVRQFVQAVAASLVPVSHGEQAQVQAVLPPPALALFRAMPRADQRHSLNVLYALRAAGQEDRALLQAALLHDCAKHEAGVRLWHRVATVLLKALAPGLLARWEASPAPRPGSWRYPLWAQMSHPARGAELAAAAGCVPLAVLLIRCHQDTAASAMGNADTDRLLAALQAADDDN